jgi:LuxR family transcriptional regulator
MVRVRFALAEDFQLVNNYPVQWRMRYHEAGYLACDPTIKQGIRSQQPMLWSDALFKDVPSLWTEAQAMGLRVGWAQSRFDGTGAGSLLTLARSGDALSRKELDSKALQLNWLVSVAHEGFTRVFNASDTRRGKGLLTRREIDVLKWAAEGKTTEDIASILGISDGTVKFHTANAMQKLNCTNRISAVARALRAGLLT